MAAVSGIAERAEIGIVRSLDPDCAARFGQAMEFLHGADDVGYVLDHVDRHDPVEGAVGERIGEAIEIAENVGLAGGIAIDADRAGSLPDPAADVENSHVFRHSSKVSRAKSHWSRVITRGGQ